MNYVKFDLNMNINFVELTSPETRDVSLAAFLDHWQSSLARSPLVEQLQIEQGDWPWPAIELLFSRDNTKALKGAADDLAALSDDVYRRILLQFQNNKNSDYPSKRHTLKRKCTTSPSCIT